MLANRPQQKGLTLTELMVSMVIGLFVTAMIITVFSTNVRSNISNMKMIRLNQELRGAMTFMIDELKRTGYSADPDNDSFMTSFDRVSASCILYSYDADSDGSRDSDEHFGFRLASNEIKWAANATDGCAFGESITDVSMANITTLDFDVTGSVNNNGVSGITALTTSTGVSVYEITITLTGSTDLPHSSDANDPRRTVIETIRIRNEHAKD